MLVSKVVGREHKPVELFFVCGAFRSKSNEFVRLAEKLTELRSSKCSASNAFYRPNTDIALLSVQFAQACSPQEMTKLLEITKQADVLVLEPARLTAKDRSSFNSYLEKYQIQFDQSDCPETALLRLCAELSLNVVSKNSQSASKAVREQSVPSPAPVEQTQRDFSKTIANEITRPRQEPGESSLEELLTAGASPVSLEESPGVYSQRRPRRARGSTFGGNSSLPNDDAPGVSVRFRRGDKWSHARLRMLAVRTANLATASPPRVNDKVSVELSIKRTSICISAIVTRVEKSEHNYSGCSLQFSQPNEAPNPQLLRILTEARRLGISLDAPPERKEARHQVRWPIRIQGSTLDFTAPAHDLSPSGLFLATEGRLPQGLISFQLPTDQEGELVMGKAKVARVIDEAMAKERDLVPGYGLQIVSLPKQHERAFREFIERVGKRSARQILVGGSRDFAETIASDLRSAGYTVSARSNPKMLMQLIASYSVPPDLAILDSSLNPRSEELARLRAAVENQYVPCIAAYPDNRRDTRQAVDKILSVQESFRP